MKSYSKYFLLTSTWFIAFYFVFSGFAYKADFKVGYVWSDKIFAEFDEAVQIRDGIETEQQEIQKQLIAKQDDFEKMVRDYENKQLMYSDSKKAEIEKDLNDQRNEILGFQQEHLDPVNGTIAQKWNTLMQPVINKVQDLIDKYCSEEGYDIIFDHKDQIPIILYAKEEYDITDTILELLKKQSRN